MGWKADMTAMWVSLWTLRRSDAAGTQSGGRYQKPGPAFSAEVSSAT